MGMQIATFGYPVAVPAPQEKQDTNSRTPLSGEPKTAEPAEFSLPGNGKTQHPDLQKTVADLEHIGLAFNRRLQFVIDQKSREIIIKVIDNETDKVIKELPPEELKRLHSRIKETIGVLFDEMV